MLNVWREEDGRSFSVQAEDTAHTQLGKEGGAAGLRPTHVHQRHNLYSVTSFCKDPVLIWPAFITLGSGYSLFRNPLIKKNV